MWHTIKLGWSKKQLYDQAGLYGPQYYYHHSWQFDSNIYWDKEEMICFAVNSSQNVMWARLIWTVISDTQKSFCATNWLSYISDFYMKCYFFRDDYGLSLKNVLYIYVCVSSMKLTENFPNSNPGTFQIIILRIS